MQAAGPGNQVIRDLLERFPKASNLAVARMAYKGGNKSLWTRMEACQLMVRRLRGKQGSAKRRDCLTVEDEREYEATRQFKLPEGMREIDDYTPVCLDDPGWWLWMSDIHCPFHDSSAINSVVKEAKRQKIAGIILAGDVFDFYAISQWQKDPRKRDFKHELGIGREFLGWLRQQFPKARKVFKLGNHEERLETFLQVKAPELLDLDEVQLAEITHATKHGYEVIGEKRPFKLGNLFGLHGHEYKTPFVNPVNPARGLFNKAKVSTACGHLHQTSQHSETDLEGRLVSCWSVACLCNLHPNYAPLNKWNHGAALVHVGQHKEYEVNNMRVVDGKVWR